MWVPTDRKCYSQGESTYFDSDTSVGRVHWSINKLTLPNFPHTVIDARRKFNAIPVAAAATAAAAL